MDYIDLYILHKNHIIDSLNLIHDFHVIDRYDLDTLLLMQRVNIESLYYLILDQHNHY